ncbi:pentatricopeptide repeat-containing protein At4g32450, mitochondrial [Carica papaya]|uniref:pentatricopeptide repeat-containing protein At4g32450, mitochondrial n=1 Tax=Carica papaya TaxID=3649 RepID=UPI000B8CE115|nr:pentatricopeptide repeat-containing protein At4g32450, mitochondrial [Carica papaya]XP_021902932.1 pentatricopeptide repeat-containing protein At4g32450, mitochondrial [Carica papaya]
MTIKRVRFGTFYPLMALARVCSSSRKSSYAIKVLNLSLRHLSTIAAVQRSDSQNTDSHHLDNLSDDPNIPTPGFSTYTGFEHRPNTHEPSGVNPGNYYFMKNSVFDETNRKFSSFQYQNPSGICGGSFASESHHSATVGQNGNFSGHYDAQYNHNNGVPFEENKNEIHQNCTGVYKENIRNNFQSNPVVQYQISTNPQAEAEGNFEAKTSEIEYSGGIEELDEFIKEGKVKEAVKLLALLENKGDVVESVKFLSLINACAEAEALQEARAVHEHVMRSLSPLKVSIYNKILEMYLKCGSSDDAFCVFDKMPERNLTTWDTMIQGLAKNGLGEDAIDIFLRFKKAGLKPDGQMFIGVFSACTVLGDIDEGFLHFESMCKDYDLVPAMEHYVSLVHMLGSTGHLDEAFDFIEKMPVEPTVDVWEALMTLCRVHGNLDLGDRCAELVGQLDPSHLNEQAKAGIVPVKASDLAKEERKKKLASQNPLEIRSRVHEYRAGDTSHPDNDRIYALLRGLREQMKEEGYIPETRFVLHDIDQESKEEALLAHSERLASAQGFLTSPARSPIRVIKNLRVCGDCHNALKIISKIVGRELIMRDAKRFHHFKNGVCSCRDYW